MKRATRDRIERLLYEALELLDTAEARLPAIHIAQALEALGRSFNSSESPHAEGGEP